MRESMKKIIYLDNAATTPIDPEVAEGMAPFLKGMYGNPSSIYLKGREARDAVEYARKKVAELINAAEDEIVFTSGGTESSNFAIKGIAYANKDKGSHIITTEIEHDSVLESMKFLEGQGFTVTYTKPDQTGLINPDIIRKAITKETILISVMHANNEIGTIQSVSKIGEIAKENDVYFHTDAVQTIGHLPVDVNILNVDLLSLSGHKFHGPKGIGALYIRKGTKIIPFLNGGGQEKRLRAGTENTLGIIGLGLASFLSKKRIDKESKKIKNLRGLLLKGLLKEIKGAKLNGHQEERLANNINIQIPGIEGEALILHLDKVGICASTGSACGSMDLEPSHVLSAIGLTRQEAHSSIRFTLGKDISTNDIRYVVKAVSAAVKDLLKYDEK
jgi:cysteine desulfurase